MEGGGDVLNVTVFIFVRLPRYTVFCFPMPFHNTKPCNRESVVPLVTDAWIRMKQ